MAFVKTKDILDYFENLVNDSPDQTTELNLANQVKDLVEDERNWIFLKARQNPTLTFNAGDSYLTAKALPTDFRKPMDSGIYVGNDIMAYLQLPFEDRDNFQDNTSHRYYIDFVNSQYFISGKPPAGAINFPYIKNTPALDLVSSNPVWPTRFWSIIPIRMAMLWYAWDQGLKQRSWDDRWQAEYETLKSKMVQWDEMVQRSSYQNRGEQRYDPKSLPLVLDL